MGNGSSSSSSQQQRNEEFADHDYEEIEERDLRGKEKFQRNHSIVTLDIKPGEWKRFTEVHKSQQGQTGGQDMWWGDPNVDEGARARGRVWRKQVCGRLDQRAALQ